jgi:hypothetical protein
MSNPDAEAQSFNLTTQWQRFVGIFTLGVQLSGNLYVRINRSNQVFTSGSSYDISNAQIEFKDYATPFVSGSRNTWNDISGNNITGSIISGSFNTNPSSITLNNTSYSGSIVLSVYQPSGSSLYFYPYSGSVFATIFDTFTYNIWCQTTSSMNLTSPGTIPTEATSGTTFAGTLYGSGQYNYIIGPVYPANVDGFPPAYTTASTGVVVGNNGIAVIEHTGGYMPGTCIYNPGNSTIIGNGWNNIVVVYNNKQASIYLNGNLVRTGLTSPKRLLMGVSIGNQTPTIGSFISYGAFRGNIGNVSYYNRALSAAEVLQNYNAQKSRFGL